MSARFHVDLGPFTVDVQLDDSGVHLSRGPRSETIAWDKISGATLIRSADGDDSEDKRIEQLAAQFLGPEVLQKMESLRNKVGQIVLAYQDENNKKRETEVPAPLSDAAFLQEFKTRLAGRWLGESRDRQQAAKRLHTNPGFFKTLFVLVALIGVLTVVAAVGLLGFLGPVLNFLSIQRMLLDLQDGNYPGFVSRLATYAALFVVGYFLHRVIRSRLDSLKSRPGRRPSLNP